MTRAVSLTPSANVTEAEQHQYWYETLSGDLPVLRIPSDYPRPPASSFLGDVESLDLDQSLYQPLLDFCAAQQCSLKVTLLAAYNALLYRYTGEEDILVGSGTSNYRRWTDTPRAEAFTNLLALRTNLAGDPDFLTLLTRTTKTVTDAYRHSAYPFAKVLEIVRARQSDQSAIIHNMFFLCNAGTDRVETSLHETNLIDLEEYIHQYDLVCIAVVHAEKLTISFHYDTGLFAPPTIIRLLGHYQSLLRAAVSHPETAISTLPLLSDTEQHQLLFEWNDTQTDYPREQCIHELFEAQVERTPKAMAVICEAQHLTYQELNARTNKLAHYLRSLGIGPEILVGIYMERSLELVISILAILKAGGAYVPLDLNYPTERLRFILEDTQTPVILTHRRCSAALPTGLAQQVFLDDKQERIEQESDEPPQSEAKANNLAYVLYTSGSTGVPKGVMVEHQGLVNYLTWCLRAYPITAGHGAPLHSSFAFDLTMTSFWAPLLSGQSVHLINEDSRSNGLQRALQQSPGFSLIKLTPAHLRLLSQQLTPQDVQGRTRAFIIGGEELQAEHLTFWREHAPDIDLINEYGPTETVVGCCVYQVPQGHAVRATIPIGRPIQNTQLYILDAARQPVPIGVVGELYIGGDGVARGYLNRPELTAAKFLPDPFSNRPGARLYRSGDLARYLPDGNIEFLGRIDNQVKVRGFRIELGEIEAVLDQHPAVQATVVLAREDKPGDKRLVAYVVSRANQKIAYSELHMFLRERVPEYMIPAAFVLLDSLPLTPNGKIDRRALPLPESTRPDLAHAFVAPRTPEEEAIAGIWREVLGLEHVGIHDNFFELGGHSLKAAQVFARLRTALQIEFPPAHGVRDANRGRAGSSNNTVGTDGTSFTDTILTARVTHGCFALSFAQQRLWFLDQLEPNRSLYNLPSALRLKGDLNISVLEQSVNEIVRRHETLRTTFSVSKDEPIQIISPTLAVPLPVVDLSSYDEQERAVAARQLAREESSQPFDLAHGPLLRVRLLRLEESDYILLVTMHHIASDAWSINVLYRELSVLYQAFSNHQPSPLPELTIQYPDYAVRQREWLDSGKLNKQLDYWKKQLDRAPRVLELPTDHPRPPVQTHAGARESLSLSTSLSERLRSFSHAENATPFMLLLAAFSILLHRYTGENDIVVGTPIAGRNQLETEGVIGFFINHLVLRIDLSENPPFREFLHRVRKVALDAYSHQDVPFERLLEELRPERNVSRTPLFQVYINQFNLDEPKPTFPGVTVEPILVSEPEAKFDLTLYIREEKKNLRLDLVYNTDLYSRPRMAEMVKQLEHLLSQIIATPKSRIEALSLVTPSAALVLPNPTKRLNNDWQGAIHERLTQQAQRWPDRVALIDPWEQWSYKTLDVCSNQVANCLRTRGIQSEDIVAIYGHRSSALVCAMLSVLKAGAAFLILDPAYPASRLLDCLEQANPRGWLQMEAAGPLPDALVQFTERLPWLCKLELPRTSTTIAKVVSAFSLDNPEIRVGPDTLACVSFTSGSTGHPKGILGRHGPLTHFLPWQEKAFRLSSSDRFSVLSGLSHDPLQRDVFTPLWVGATMCIPDPDIIGTSHLAKWLAQERITFAHLTPPMLNVLAETAERNQRIVSLRHVFFVGDSLTQRDVERARNLSPQVTCIASYGTTETQRAVSYNMIAPDLDLRANHSKPDYPLGRGMEDTQLLVLNSERQLAGIGEFGEIYVRSPHLARGYLHDEVLTATKFLNNPFTKDDSDRLYRTGDIGRYLPDGNIEFLGRTDNQVKIRGFRIELGEIETLLTQYKTVREALVIAREDTPGEKRLVAYLVSHERSLPTHDLRNFLKTKLPEYMVPSAFVFVTRLPLTPNGKVDHSALPKPDHAMADREEPFTAPRSPVEESIAAIWREVLGLEQIGIHDNFFDLGGHSLLASMVISRINKWFPSVVSLRSMFEFPTVAALATLTTEQQEQHVSDKAVDHLLSDIEAMSEEEVEQLLTAKA